MTSSFERTLRILRAEVNRSVNRSDTTVRIVRDMQHSSSQPASSPAPRSFRSPLASALIVEWDRLLRSATIAARVRSGPLAALVGGPGDGAPRDEHPLDAVLRTCGFLEPPTEASDRAMLDLVDLARDDELAARIALQRILPALVAIARRRGPMVGGVRRAFDDVLASAWIAVRTYPVERRPHKVVANLVRDAEYLAFVRSARLKAAGEHVGLPVGGAAPIARLDGSPTTAAVDPRAEFAELLADARRTGVAAADLEFATAWAGGADNLELAARLGCCERTVRNRRREVVSRLRQVALAA